MRTASISRLVVGAVLMASTSGIAQTRDGLALRARLQDARPLSSEEISRTLHALRDLLAAAPFRITLGLGAGPEYVVDTNGRARLIRNTTDHLVTWTKYTGRSARYCDGSPAPGELVIELRQAGAGWSISARHSTESEVGQPILDAISGAVVLEDDGLSEDGRSRRLRAAWAPVSSHVESQIPGGGSISSRSVNTAIRGTQTLYVDVASLRPTRWELKATAGDSRPTRPVSYLFEYDKTLVLQEPAAGAVLPECIDASQRSGSNRP